MPRHQRPSPTHLDHRIRILSSYESLGLNHDFERLILTIKISNRVETSEQPKSPSLYIIGLIH